MVKGPKKVVFLVERGQSLDADRKQSQLSILCIWVRMDVGAYL